MATTHASTQLATSATVSFVFSKCAKTLVLMLSPLFVVSFDLPDNDCLYHIHQKIYFYLFVNIQLSRQFLSSFV